MTYSEKLKDPRWQKKRLEIFTRDNWVCQSCGDTKTSFNIHHLKYFPGKEPWEYENHFLVTYCEKCHETEHLIGDDINDCLLEIVKDNTIFIKPISQITILVEKWPFFYRDLKAFLNNSMINYLKWKTDAEQNAKRLDQQRQD